jgi:hypothetical protein
MIVATASFFYAVPAYSHHSAGAVFTDEDIVIEGYVSKFLFKNPHISVYLDVAGEDGEVTQWMGTGPATPSLHRQGWTKNTLREGQYLRLSGKKGRNNRPMILFSGSDIAAGSAIIELNPLDKTVVRVLSKHAGSGGVPPATGAEGGTSPLALTDGRVNLTGQWFGGLQAMITDQTTPPLNNSGEAMQATFDPINDPTFSECSGEVGLIRQAASILPQRISQSEDTVLFEYEGFAGRRVIYLNEQPTPTDELTHLGRHVARYEDDALVIETTGLLGNLTGGEGNALSDRTTTIETYRRADTESSGPLLELTMVVTDPGHLTEPWTIITRKVFSPDYVFAGRDCQLPLLGSGETD